MTDSEARILICIDHDGFPASIENRKVYREIPDPDAAAQGMVRIVDETGEDYLFPKHRFLAVELSAAAASAIL